MKKIIAVGIISMFLLTGLSALLVVGMKANGNVGCLDDPTQTLTVYLVAHPELYPINGDVVATDPDGVEFHLEGDDQGFEYIGELPVDENPNIDTEYVVTATAQGCIVIEEFHIININIAEPVMPLIFHVVDDNNNPPNKPSIAGPSSNLKAGTSYDYTFSATDPEGDQIYYCIDWGDGSDEICIGPFDSGDPQTVSHEWPESEKTYTIKATAKDIHGNEGPEGTLSVSTPKNKLINLESGIYVENAKKISFPITIVVGNTNIKVDAEGASKVKFYLDDDEQPRYIDDEAPYEWLWDEFSFGRHTLTVEAYDNAGNSDTDEMTVWKFF